MLEGHVGKGHVGTGLLLVHDAAKPWDRRSPERLGINSQVVDFFHGRLDTGGPRAHASPNTITMLEQLSLQERTADAAMCLRLGRYLPRIKNLILGGLGVP